MEVIPLTLEGGRGYKLKEKTMHYLFLSLHIEHVKIIACINSVWNQQARFFQYEDRCQDPEVFENFDTQLCCFIGKVWEEGHNVVLGMDANDDVRNGKISKALEDIGMSEAIVKFHKEKSPPATCATNTQLKVIDSIWTSPSIHILWCGFLPFHVFLGFISDHRLTWADISNQSLYGHRPQNFSELQLWGWSQTILLVKKYARRILEQYNRKGLVHKFGALD